MPSSNIFQFGISVVNLYKTVLLTKENGNIQKRCNIIDISKLSDILSLLKIRNKVLR